MAKARGPDAEALAARLRGIRAQHPDADPALVADVVRAVLDTMHGSAALREGELLGAVAELGRVIAAAKADIAALRVDDISASHIPTATDELDAIAAQTEAATVSILEVCEGLDRIAAASEGAHAARLQEATMRIYEACGFQDITGQRIAKVVATLKTIDAKVAQLLSTFGIAAAAPAAASPQPDGVLLHGPQLPENAMHQSDVDALLAQFD